MAEADRPNDDEPKVTVRDKRRLDPETGELREPTEPEVTTTSGSELEQQLSERTDDLLRLKAEFDNYRKRAQAQIAQAAEAGVTKVLGALLPALDDVERARQHGEVEGGFKAVADHLERTLTSHGLARFGAAGETFDPTRHEALTSVEDPGVAHEVVKDVYRHGYEHQGKVIRPAQVVVATPAHPGPDAAAGSFEIDPLGAPLPNDLTEN